MSSSRRESAKKGGSSSWKERLRSQCFQRLRQERQRILWAARGDQSSMKGALQLLISDVSGSLGQAPSGAGFPSTPAACASPAGLAASTPPAAAAAAAAVPEVFQLEGEEYEELMQALEASLLEEQLQEEAAYLERLEQQEMQEVVDAYYAHHCPADQQQQQQQQPGQPGQPEPGPSSDAGVLCPLCGQAYLVQHRGVILCPQRDLRLDVGLEGLQLEDLRQRLAQALQAHSQSGCHGQPGFMMPPQHQQHQQHQQQEGGPGGAAAAAAAAAMGGSMLWMACQQCGCLEVVL